MAGVQSARPARAGADNPFAIGNGRPPADVDESVAEAAFLSRFLDGGCEDELSREQVASKATRRVSTVSVEEAAASLLILMPQLDSFLASSKTLVELRSDAFPRAMSADQACALALLVAAWDPAAGSLHRVLNSLLRIGDCEGLEVFHPMLKLMALGLQKMQPVNATVWRGVRADLRGKYIVGATVTWWGFASCAIDMAVFEEDRYLGSTGCRTLFAIDARNAYDMRLFASTASETEIILPAGLTFEVTSVADVGGGLVVVQLKQIASPHSILDGLESADNGPALRVLTPVHCTGCSGAGSTGFFGMTPCTVCDGSGVTEIEALDITFDTRCGRRLGMTFRISPVGGVIVTGVCDGLVQDWNALRDGSSPRIVEGSWIVRVNGSAGSGERVRDALLAGGLIRLYVAEVSMALDD